MLRLNCAKIFLICLISTLATQGHGSVDDVLMAHKLFFANIQVGGNEPCIGLMVSPVHVLTTGFCAFRNHEHTVTVGAYGGQKSVHRVDGNHNHLQLVDEKDSSMNYNSIRVLELDYLPEVNNIVTFDIDKFAHVDTKPGDDLTFLVTNTLWDPAKDIRPSAVKVISKEECEIKGDFGSKKRRSFALPFYGPNLVCASKVPQGSQHTLAVQGSPVYCGEKICGLSTYENGGEGKLPMMMIKLTQSQIDFVKQKINEVDMKKKIKPLDCWGCGRDNRDLWNGKPLFGVSPDAERCNKCFDRNKGK